MNWRHCSHPSVILAICLGLAPVALAAQAGDPVGDISLPYSTVSLNLERSTVRISVDSSVEPGVRWWRRHPDDPGSAELLVTRDGDAGLIQRPAQTDGAPGAILIIEVAVSDATPINVTGFDLDLTVDRTTPEATEAEEPRTEVGSAGWAGLELQLRQSQASVSGAGQILGRFSGSHVELRETVGVHDLTLTESSLQIVSHKGQVTVAAQGSDLTSVGTEGALVAQTTGGSINLRSTRGSFKIVSQDAHIQILDSSGTGSLVITGTTLDLRESSIQSLSLKSTSSHTTIENCPAITSGTVEGGSFTASAIEGRTTLNLIDGASLDIVDHIGDVNLNLQQDSSADLSSIQGEARITATDSEVDLHSAQGLTLRAYGSRATVSDITRLSKFEATNSEIEIDLSAIRSRSLTAAVFDESYVRIALATPCRVQATNVDTSLARQVDVSGCELKLGSSGRWATGKARGIDGQKAITLSVQVAESAELIVEGRP